MLKISGLCHTTIRTTRDVRLIEEGIESFLRQDYPNKELIVLNDSPEQTLRFDHPLVRIVNTLFRCGSPGESRWLVAGFARGELLCPWPASAISLPWRLTRSAELLAGAAFYTPREYWFLDSEGPLHDCMPMAPYFASLCRRSGYPELEDATRLSPAARPARDAWPRSHHAERSPSLPMEDWFSIYRWPAPDEIEPDGAGESRVEQGEVTLDPHWEQDYVLLTRSYAAALQQTDASERVGLVAPRRAKYPLRWRLETSDFLALHQVLLTREYSCLNDRTEVDLILDCGANAGYSAAFFLTRFPDSTVIAVEPEPGNAALLRQNLAPYGGRARVVQAGVWSHECFLTLATTRYRDGLEWSRQVMECSPEEKSNLRGVTIGSLLAGSGYPRISILKMDIEGAEGVVFSGDCSSWLERVDCILIELHDDSHFGPCSEIFFRAISAQGFTISTIDELTICKRN